MDALEWALGVLVYAGHDVDEMLDRYSLEQLGAHAGWVVKYQTEMLNMVLGPMAAMQGAEWKPHTTEKKKPARNKPSDPKHHKNADYDDLDLKERALNAALSRRFRVRVKPAADPGDSDGSGQAG